jgi:aspartate ammonia-lyase
MRIERDILGEVSLPDNALYGIQSVRSRNNFPPSGEEINPLLVQNFLLVKKACAQTNYEIGTLIPEKYNAISAAIDELLADKNRLLQENLITDPYQGGAGTSLNMNINEVIANLALLRTGSMPGTYTMIHPLDDVNKNQSTNDVYPTAFKAAALSLLRALQEAFSSLQKELQKKENEFSGVLKLGRTQMQDAVPMTLGQEFGAWAQAISRDRWRFYNAEERLRSVNMGGTAIGNGVAGDPKFTAQVYTALRSLTGLPLAKSEDLIDGTQNLDVIVEAHAIIKAGAVTLQKIANDLRLLSSGPNGGLGEIILPAMQAGSTIMPGKVNPVIPEHTIQIAELVKGHDMIISNLIGAGNLELHQFMPMIAHLFLKSQSLLRSVALNLATQCISGIQADAARCMEHLERSTAIATILIPEYGYDRIADLVKSFPGKGTSFIQFASDHLSVTREEIVAAVRGAIGVSPEQQ